MKQIEIDIKWLTEKMFRQDKIFTKRKKKKLIHQVTGVS